MSRIRFIPIAALALIICSPVRAQQAAPSATDIHYAAAIAKVCPGHWQAQPCLAALSASNLVLAANYGSGLQQAGHAAEAEQIKQHCAASTAAMNGTFPAYAFRSAFTECANTMADISQATGMIPDQAQYQLLVGATLCLSGDARCAAITQGLQAYANR